MWTESPGGFFPPALCVQFGLYGSRARQIREALRSPERSTMEALQTTAKAPCDVTFPLRRARWNGYEAREQIKRLRVPYVNHRHDTQLRAAA